MSEQPAEKIGFLEEAPGVKSSSRLVMVLVGISIVSAFLFCTWSQKEIPSVPWELVVLLAVSMGLKDIKDIAGVFKK